MHNLALTQTGNLMKQLRTNLHHSEPEGSKLVAFLQLTVPEQEDVDGLRQREVEASKAAAECQEMLSELQDFAAHQQAQIQQLTEEREV